MNGSLSERKQVENEVYFRQSNEQIQTGFDEINKIAKDQGEPRFLLDSSARLAFFCECADEKCAIRIDISLDNYNDIHKNYKTFTIVPGHQVKAIETIVRKEPTYWIVEKDIEPPKRVKSLNTTHTNNV